MANSPTIVVLIGYMGSGKSVVGQLLAKQLNIPFVDADAHLESETQQTISEIFNQKGELGFRKMERQMLHELLNTSSEKVISLGGGAPCYFDNMNIILDKATQVVYLDVSIPVLVDRLWLGKNHRPVIAHIDSKESLTEFVGKHLFERRPFYRKSPIAITINMQTPDEIVSKILKKL